MKTDMSNVVQMRGNATLLRAVATAFVVLFSLVHLLDAGQRRETCEKGYFATLTVFTLLLTAYVTVACSPPALVAAVLAVNVVVCAIYYGVVNQSFVGGTSFLLHGGCALILAGCAWSGSLDCGARPWMAAAVCGALLLSNALLQIRHEKVNNIRLYPSCHNFENPLWRTFVIPAVGSCVAGFIASAAG